MSTGNTGKPVIEILIRDRAPELADQIRKAAKWAQSEADLQHAVEKQLDSFRAEAGIKKDQFDTSHQNVTIGKSGRPDSRYQTFFIEYKSPNFYKKKDSANYAFALKQITDRFDDLVAHENRKKEHIFGVGLDGHDFIFVRWQRNDWDVRFQEVNEVSAEHFLRKLVDLAAHGRSFTPEQLAGDFGSEADVASEAIHHFYEAIIRTQNPRARTFFEQWKILFGEVCGYDVTSLSDKLKKLAKFYLKLETCKPAELMFAVHTYFALFMKLLAGQIVSAFLDPGGMTGNALANLQGSTTPAALKAELEKIESGGIFRDFARITNFLEGDLFAWYLDVWDEELKANFGKLEIPRVVRDVIDKLDGYDLTTLSVEPEETRDLLKHLYQNLFPQPVRHDLGEYYTPDWLAEHVLNEVGFDGDPEKRVLDPACGSGTFLVLTIARIIEHEQKLQRPLDANLLKKITANVIGFDLNPLAVMASRVNYLLALRALFRKHPPFEIPVYLCDSILTPSEYGGELFRAGVGEANELKTAAFSEENEKLPKSKQHHFLIPLEISKPRDVIAKYADALEFCIRHDYSPDEFLKYCRKQQGLDLTKDELHEGLYNDLRELERMGRNGIWARIIKNAFAPLFVERVDYVVGNPPWVRWSYLPNDYRDSTKPLWQQYGLFSVSGSAATLGSGEKELAQLFVYCCMDNFLKNTGVLGFLITQSVFRTGGQSAGFRGFKLRESKYILVQSVHDFSALQVFEGAANKTCAFTAKIHDEPNPRIPYYEYFPRKGRLIPFSASLEDANNKMTRVELSSLVDNSDEDRRLIVSPPQIRIVLKGDKSAYTFKRGAATDPYGVFHIEVLDYLSDGKCLVKNLRKGKFDVPEVTKLIESELVFPLAMGADVFPVEGKGLKRCFLMVQNPETRTPIPETVLRDSYPGVHSYLSAFRSVLDMRKSRAMRSLMERTSFYAQYGISTEILSADKVICNRMGTRFRAAYFGPQEMGGVSKPVIPGDTTVYCVVSSREEGLYLSALLCSALVNYKVLTMSSAGRGLASPSVLTKIPISKFDRSRHRQLVKTAELYLQSTTPSEEISRFSEIDREIFRLYNIDSPTSETLLAYLRQRQS